MLSNLSLTRFQGFARRADVPIKPLTLIFGPNASGKSSIIRSMLLAKQSLVPNSIYSVGRIGFEYEGESISLASFANVVYKHDETSSYLVEIAIENIQELFNSSTRKQIRDSKANRGFVDLEDQVREVKTVWEVSKSKAVKAMTLNISFKGLDLPVILEFRIENEAPSRNGLVLDYKVSFTNLDSLFAKIDETLISSDSPEEQLMKVIFAESDEIQGESESKPKILKDKFAEEKQNIEEILESLKFKVVNGNFIRLQSGVAGGSILALNLGQILDFQQAVFARSLRGIRHIGPLREISKRLTYEAGSIEAIDDDSQIVEIEPLENEVSKWLYSLTDGRYSLSPVESYLGQVRFLGALKSQILTDNRTGTPVTFQDVGVGLSQILPILESISKASAGNGQTILIEQPEIHLHPKMQANLVDLFIDFVSSSPKTRTIIAETHSEAMLLRIQKRIREKTLDSSLVQIIYVDQSPQAPEDEWEEGNFAFPLPLDANGDFIMPMPNSFSSLRFEDLL